MSTTVRTNVQGPCEGCAHHPVCSRATRLGTLSRAIEAQLPPLPEGLAVRMLATVECDAYLRAKGSNTHARSAVTPPGEGDSDADKPKPSGGEWTPERRQRMAEAMRQRNAKRLTGNVTSEPIQEVETAESVG